MTNQPTSGDPTPSEPPLAESSQASTPGAGETTTKSVKRRSVLKWTGIGLGALAIAGGGGYLGYLQSLKIPGAEADKVAKRQVVIAGGSIAGLTVAAQLKRAVPDAKVTIIEPNTEHHYQPGYTLIGADVYKPDDVRFDEASLIPSGVTWIKGTVEAFDPDKNSVRTSTGETLTYDFLVVAVGVVLNPTSVQGLTDALKTPHVSHVYDWTLAQKWRDIRNGFGGGEVVVHYPNGYVKCGGAPQKQLWLIEDYWRSKGMRDKVSISYFTPQKSMFPAIKVIDDYVTPMTTDRGIKPKYFHVLKAVDGATRTAIFEETLPDKTTREVRQKYDLLHAMPNFTVPKALGSSPLTNETLKGQVEVNRETLQHVKYKNVFALGDAAGTGAGKTAATVRKQAPTVVGNIIDMALDRPISHKYNGTSGCPLLTRYGKCMMIEFDYAGNLINEELYDSRHETELWWNFKVHGLKRIYRDVMIQGYQTPF